MPGRSLAVVAGSWLLAAATWAQAVPKGEIPLSEGVVGGVITDGPNEWSITGPAAEPAEPPSSPGTQQRDPGAGTRSR